MCACVLGSFEVIKYVFLCVGSTGMTPIFLFNKIVIFTRFLAIVIPFRL